MAVSQWCWRRRLCIARGSNQPLLKELNPEYLLEALMLKLQYFGHLTRRADSLEKTLVPGKVANKRRREGQQRMRWLDSIADSKDMNLSKVREIGKDREVCRAAVLALQRVGHDLVTERQSSSET